MYISNFIRVIYFVLYLTLSNESNSILSRLFEIKYSMRCEQEMLEATSELTKTNSFHK